MPAFVSDVLSGPALSLAEYSRLISYDECAFWGVTYDEQTQYDCRTLWTEAQRLMVYRALQEAQGLIEDVVGYPLQPTWIVGAATEFGEQRLVDYQPARNPILTRWGYVIGGGVKATTTIDDDAAVSHATDPAIVGPLTTTISNVAEVKVYHPVTGDEITPSRLTYSGGQLTIYIPRCRLTLTPNLTDLGVAYDDLDNFLDEVNVVRIYNDPSTQAALSTDATCGTVTTGAGYLTIRDHRIGHVEATEATYSGGVWTKAVTCNAWQWVGLNYVAGLRSLDTLMQTALLRLAHSRMAEEPCGCQVTQALWARDRKTPEVLSAERLNCPFGSSEGAWVAYKTAQQKKIYRLRTW